MKSPLSAITNRLATPPLDNDLNGELGIDAATVAAWREKGVIG